MHWRDRKGLFDKDTYPIDNTAELIALKKFLGPLKPDELASDRIRCESKNPAVQICALHSKASPDCVYGWLFSTIREAPFSINGLTAGNYAVTWFDPWTGEPIPNLAPQEFTAKENESVQLDALYALKVLRANLPPFPAKSRLSKGHDAAFKIERK